MAAFDTILVPADFSDDAGAALDLALDLGKRLGATVHLLHVYHRPVEMLSPYGVALPPTVDREIRESAEKRLTVELERAKKSGVECAAHVREGVAGFEIAETAKELGADLIVMGTRGLSGLKHVLFGSVAERTVRTAECPVLSVKAPD